jgi:hypothetical protein
MFTALIASDVVRTVTLYLIFRFDTYAVYFYSYWGLAFLDLLLQFFVVYEMASNVFQPLGTWSLDVRRGMFWLICGSVAVAIAFTWFVPVMTSDWRQALVNRGDFFSAVLMTELFVGMIALSTTVGLPWRTHTARISQGLGIYSAACILVETSERCIASTSQVWILTLTHLRMGIYLLCVAYWIVMLWRDEPATKALPDEIRRQLYSLHSQIALHLSMIRGIKS